MGKQKEKRLAVVQKAKDLGSLKELKTVKEVNKAKILKGQSKRRSLETDENESLEKTYLNKVKRSRKESTTDEGIFVKGAEGLFEFNKNIEIREPSRYFDSLEEAKNVLKDVLEQHELGESAKNEIRDILFKLKTFLEKDLNAIHINDYKRFHLNKFNGKFMAPKNLEVVGNYLFSGGAYGEEPISPIDEGNSIIVDLAFEMDYISMFLEKSKFQSVETFNYVYLNNKRHYLEVLKRVVSDSFRVDTVSEIKVDLGDFMNDLFSPIIVLKLNLLCGLKLSIRLFCGINENSIPLDRLLVTRSNLYDEENPKEGRFASPFYNMRVLEDVHGSLSFGNLFVAKLFNEVQKNFPGFYDASKMLDLFVDILACNFGKHELKLLLAYCLLEEKNVYLAKLASGADGFELFSKFIVLLGSENFQIYGKVLRYTPIATGWDEENIPSNEFKTTQREHSDENLLNFFPISLMSPCGRYNFLWRVSQSPLSYFSLRSACKNLSKAEDLLKFVMKQRIEKSLSSLSLDTTAELLFDYDTIIILKKKSISADDGLLNIMSPRQTIQFREFGLKNYLLFKLEQIIAEGLILSRRILICKLKLFEKTVILAFSTNAVELNRLVDKGPPASDSKSCDDFRGLWGEKAELRRFDDAIVREAVVWNQISDVAIFQQIFRYLVGRHLPLFFDADAHVQSFSHFSLEKHSVASVFEENIKDVKIVNRTIESFKSDLLNLSLDLRIKEVNCLGPIARGTESSASQFLIKNSTSIVSPIRATIWFETSPRWPDNINAIRLLKIAFFSEISAKLSASSDVYCEAKEIPSGVQFLIFYRECCFDVYIMVEREDYLLRNLPFNIVENEKLKNKLHASFDFSIHDAYLNKHNTSEILKLTKRELSNIKEGENLIETRSNADLDGQIAHIVEDTNKYMNRLHAFTEISTICKSWINCLLLSDVEEDMIDLLIIDMMSSTAAVHSKNQGFTWFLNFLDYLSKADFEFQPVVVNFDSTLIMSIDMQKQIKTQFEHLKSTANASLIVAYIYKSADGSILLNFQYSRSICFYKLIEFARVARNFIGEKFANALNTASRDSLEVYNSSSKLIFAPAINQLGGHIMLKIKSIKAILREVNASQDFANPTTFKNLSSTSAQNLERPVWLRNILVCDGLLNDLAFQLKKWFNDGIQVFYDKTMGSRTMALRFALNNDVETKFSVAKSQFVTTNGKLNFEEIMTEVVRQHSQVIESINQINMH